MRRSKLSKRIFALFSVFLILAAVGAVTVVSALNLLLDVNVLNVSFCSGLYISYTTSGGSTYTNTYAEGSTIVLTDMTSASSSLTLNTSGVSLGFTGFVVYLTEESDDLTTNLIGYYTDLEADSAGRYYVSSDEEWTWTVSTSSTMYFSATPVNYAFISLNDLGYQAGYDDGYAAALEYYEAQINDLTIENDMLTAAATSSSQSYQLGYSDGYSEGAATHQYIKDVTVTTVNGFGSVVAQMLQLEVLGIKVYQIALLACMIPLFFFLLKIATHIGGSS